MSEGYEIQVEILSVVKRQGFKINEIPIVFRDRIEGESKLGSKEVWGFVKKLFTLTARVYMCMNLDARARARTILFENILCACLTCAL
jgi:hypothetical protein